MKKHCIFLALLGSILSSSGSPAAQNDLDSLAKTYRLDFAIPDAPAFKVLGSDPSNILKPTSVREIGVGISDFLGSENTFVLPKSFAIEFSPALLIRGSTLTVKDYQDNAWLYRARLSLATNRPEERNEATTLAVGIRVTQIDESDLRTRADYDSAATQLAKQINDLVSAEVQRYPPVAGESGTVNLKEFPEIKRQIDDIRDAFREKWADEKWNARILEYAIALRATSPDSLGQNLKVDNVAVWYTSGYGFGSWGQLLLGLNGTYEKDSLDGDYGPSVSLSSRFYIGTNQYKVFAEGQWSIEDERKAQWLLNGGGEVKLSGSIWADFSAGTEYVRDTKKTRLVTDFTLKYGF